MMTHLSSGVDGPEFSQGQALRIQLPQLPFLHPVDSFAESWQVSSARPSSSGWHSVPPREHAQASDAAGDVCRVAVAKVTFWLGLSASSSRWGSRSERCLRAGIAGCRHKRPAAAEAGESPAQARLQQWATQRRLAWRLWASQPAPAQPPQHAHALLSICSPNEQGPEGRSATE